MSDEKRLLRDVDATLIPDGIPFTLRRGARVVITHRLGGHFTVLAENGMYRIAARDADSLGEELPGPTATPGSPPLNPGAPSVPLDESQIRDQLKLVYDPEIPVNIVDLGLVYNTEILPLEDGRFRVNVDMTLTAPGCGMGPVIADDARHRLLTLPGVGEADVRVVWDPPWNQEMISEEGKMILGLI